MEVRFKSSFFKKALTSDFITSQISVLYIEPEPEFLAGTISHNLDFVEADEALLVEPGGLPPKSMTNHDLREQVWDGIDRSMSRAGKAESFYNFRIDIYATLSVMYLELRVIQLMSAARLLFR
jgi:hypothetical protein